MKEIAKKFFVCEYCGKEFFDEGECHKHELECKKDYELKSQQEARKKEVEEARDVAQKAISKFVELEDQYRLDYKKARYDNCSFFDFLWR